MLMLWTRLQDRLRAARIEGTLDQRGLRVLAYLHKRDQRAVRGQPGVSVTSWVLGGAEDKAKTAKRKAARARIAAEHPRIPEHLLDHTVKVEEIIERARNAPPRANPPTEEMRAFSRALGRLAAEQMNRGVLYDDPVSRLALAVVEAGLVMAEAETPPPSPGPSQKRRAKSRRSPVAKPRGGSK